MNNPSPYIYPGLVQTFASDLDCILAGICRASGISRDVICSHTRKREAVIARQVFCWQAKAKTGHSLAKIGEFLGSYDHTSIIHSIKKVNEMLQVGDRMTTELVNKLNK